MPMRVADEDTDGEETWVLYDTSTGIMDLGLRFSEMTQANLYAVEHPSFKWTILAADIGVG